MMLLGIDPGLGGSLCFYDNESKECSYYRMPVNDKHVSNELYRLMKIYKPTKIILEKVHAMPGQGVTSMFTFGRVYGEIYGIIKAYGEDFGHELIEVPPATWKRYHGLLKGQKDDVLNYVSIKDKNKQFRISMAEAYLMILYYLKEQKNEIIIEESLLVNP